MLMMMPRCRLLRRQRRNEEREQSRMVGFSAFLGVEPCMMDDGFWFVAFSVSCRSWVITPVMFLHYNFFFLFSFFFLFLLLLLLGLMRIRLPFLLRFVATRYLSYCYPLC
jgi:hypothetical protein